MMSSSGILNVAKMGSIQDAVNAVAIASRDQLSLLKQSLIRRFMSLNGQRTIEKKSMPSVVDGMKIISRRLVPCHWLRPRNILKQTMVKESAIKELRIGTRKILRSGARMIGRCMLLRKENSLGLKYALNVVKNVSRMPITRTIQNLLMSFGYVPYAISTYITVQNITVREQARKLRKKMRCSDPLTKAVETCRNDMSANVKQFYIGSQVTASGKPVVKLDSSICLPVTTRIRVCFGTLPDAVFIRVYRNWP